MADFNRRLQSMSPSILSKIAEIDEIKGRWTEGVNLSPQLLGRLKKSVLITSSGASTRIEGAKLSDEDVEKFIQGLHMSKFRDRDKQEVQGYYELLENVFNAWKTIPLSENSIKHLHNELLKYAEKDVRHKGDYKKIENDVAMFDADGKAIGIVFETTPAYLAPKQTGELVAWTRVALEEKKYHPLLIIGSFIVEFLKIHPFQDGNGRLSRILTNLLLLKSGYGFVPYVSHEKIVEDNKSAYYLALRKSQKTLGGKHAEITVWLEYFLMVVGKQARMAIEMLSTEKIETLLSPKQLVIWNYMLSVDETTAGEIVKRTRVLRPTVNQALTRLLDMKKIQRIGMGRTTRYRIIEK
ncbi:MAG: Fic family protein [bacterium]|nr:Fic family protein [bacterium]